MPSKPLKPCAVIGCHKLTRDRYCTEHSTKAKDYDTHRGTAAQRGYDRRWRRYRFVYLAEHPWCVECLKESIYTPAKAVDHIIPHKGDMELFWDPKNHQGLCTSCHSRKTVREDGGFGNTPRSKKF